MKKLEICDNDHSLGWVDFSTIIAGKTTFTLTYSLKDDKWCASIKDGYNEALCLDFDVCDETAFGLIDSDEYMELKEMHSDYKKGEMQIKEKESPNELKNAFKEVIRLARGGQQPWWTEDLKNKSDKSIACLEQHYKEKYDE